MDRRKFLGTGLGLPLATVPVINFRSEEFRRQTKEYVLMMLGAPVAPVEMDDTQLDFCHDMTCKELDEGCAASTLKLRGGSLLRQGTLAHATVMLGMIRRMYIVPKHGDLDGAALHREGNLLLKDFREEIKVS